jgi:hypothetical protein
LFDDAPSLNGGKYESGEYIGDTNVNHVVSPVVFVGAGGKIISVLEGLDFPWFCHFYNNQSQFIIIKLNLRIYSIFNTACYPFINIKKVSIYNFALR